MERGEAAYEDYYKQDFWLNFQGDNARKHILLFGDESKSRFASQVPVWQLSGGEKVSSTLTLSVHAALAEDVKEIFTEIYNDPERFPIHDVGGYAWRGDSATGEHNCGTAIDINANENYQIRDGQVLAGSCWEPGSNAYSISPDSSVVRIFAEHGWSWGLQQRRFRGLPRLYALLLHGRVTKQPTPGLGSGVGFHYPPLD